MRLLVACGICARQYDVTKRPVNTVFHCDCGEPVTIREARGHDAAVVRCSSCGAPCDEDSSQCKFCEADVTIHERDLHTVCPQCMARISDKARYCHHCATPIVAEELEERKTTTLSCPACEGGPQLTSRRLGSERLTVAECEHCGGLWLDKQTFSILRDRVAGQSNDLAASNVAERRKATLQKQRGSRYRKCLTCESLMTRRQYAKGSGVILDVCKRHGIWFDAGELHQLVAWISSGGRTARPITGAARDAAAQATKQVAAGRPTAKTATPGPAAGPPPVPNDPPVDARPTPGNQDPIVEVLTELSKNVGKLFEGNKNGPLLLILAIVFGLFIASAALRGCVRMVSRAFKEKEKAPPAAEAMPRQDVQKFALRFQGGSNNVRISNLSYKGFRPLTVEAWIRPERFDKRNTIVGDGEKSGFYLGFDQGYCAFQFHDGKETRQVSAKEKSPLSRTLHVAGVYNPKEKAMALFIDGTKVDSLELGSWRFKSAKVPIMIGGLPRTATLATRCFVGLIDQVRISEAERYTVDFVPPRNLPADAATRALFDFDEGRGSTTRDSSGRILGRIQGALWVKIRQR